MTTQTDGPATDRPSFPAWHTISTRWSDNDQYGHVNNAKFYEFVDTAVNTHLLLAWAMEGSIGLVVESGCRYAASLAYPEVIEVGFRADHVGNSSVRYGFGVFRQGSDVAAATGHFVHVYVDAQTRRPRPLPPQLRAVVEAIKPA